MICNVVVTMVQYYIDAYNVIRSNETMNAGKLQDQRERLLRLLDERKPQGNNPVIVVFDGKPGRDWKGWKGEIQVVFSMEIDADTEIRNRVDAMINPASAVVVTNDRAIQKWVRGAGARVVGCADFLKAGAGRKKPDQQWKIEPADASAITEYLKKVWKI
jgi:predicted RNA-binding protein with PIN domain